MPNKDLCFNIVKIRNENQGNCFLSSGRLESNHCRPPRTQKEKRIIANETLAKSRRAALGPLADVDEPDEVEEAPAAVDEAVTEAGASDSGIVVAECMTVSWPSESSVVMVVDWMYFDSSTTSLSPSMSHSVEPLSASLPCSTTGMPSAIHTSMQPSSPTDTSLHAITSKRASPLA